jgi:glycosyltransferase involved in cell wall biosynthesis
MLAASETITSPAPQVRRVARNLVRPAWRVARRALRSALVRYARAGPRDGGDDTQRRVFILLASAWGIGGTIRASHNLAGHLADTYAVEILSVFRRVDEPFFPFPPGVRVTALDDQRPGATRWPLRPLRWVLTRFPSALMHPADRAAAICNLWVDLMLVRKLRGQSGFLIGTRPGFNLIAADLALPGFIMVGQEHMHFSAHARPLRGSMKRKYRRLDALAVLTDKDLQEYEPLVKDRVRLVRIPNAAEIGGPKADLSSKTVLAAGRLTGQKGFDMLIPAFGDVVRTHPDWRLRICGRGHLREELERLIADAELGDVIDLAGPRDLEEEMANASIFALSSRYEGFPVVLLEAMSKGMAVVSFDCPTGPADVVDDHRNGILVPLGDVAGLATGIREFIEDEGLRRRCADAAVETASSYTMDAVGREWDELLEELAGRRAGARLARVGVAGR